MKQEENAGSGVSSRVGKLLKNSASFLALVYFPGSINEPTCYQLPCNVSARRQLSAACNRMITRLINGHI